MSFLVLAHSVIPKASQSVSDTQCHVAQNRCVGEHECSMALHNYILTCGDMTRGEITHCSNHCKKALLTLLSVANQRGIEYMTCNCGDDDICMSKRAPARRCCGVLDAVQHAADDTPIVCSIALLICHIDTQCLKAMTDLKTNCKESFDDPKCKQSLTVFHRQEKARKLKTCLCHDGEDDQWCHSPTNNSSLCNVDLTGKHRIRHHLPSSLSTDTNIQLSPLTVNSGSNQKSNYTLVAMFCLFYIIVCKCVI